MLYTTCNIYSMNNTHVYTYIHIIYVYHIYMYHIYMYYTCIIHVYICIDMIYIIWHTRNQAQKGPSLEVDLGGLTICIYEYIQYTHISKK